MTGSHATPRATSGMTGSHFTNPNDNGYKPIKVKKKHHKHRRKGVKVALIIFGVLLAVILACVIALLVWINSLDSSMGFNNDEEQFALKDALATPVEAEDDNAFYMLLLGSDARKGDTASRSDVTMLVRLDPDESQVSLVSIPRDTMVTIEGHGTQKINAAYSFGGAAGAVDVVSEFAGVPISHYAEVHFEELEEVVDMLGGVWVDVPESFEAGNGGMALDAGMQRLSGEQALAFARERYNVSGGDFGRAQAQRIIVEAIIDEVLDSPPIELPRIVGRLASSVTTDFSMSDLVSLAQQFQNGSKKSGATIYSAACPSYSHTQDGVSYVCTMFDEWHDMMCRVDSGLDPNDEDSEIPEEQASNLKLGAASNSPAPRDYEELAQNAGLTTDDVASVSGTGQE